MADASESASVERHHAAGPRRIACAVITVSDTRTLADDTGGALLVELLEGAGHAVVSRVIVRDDRDAIAAAVQEGCDTEGCQAVLLTGGTGVAPRDVTPEAVKPLLDRELPGFGELFRVLSYEEIGPAAILSRALAGFRGTVLVAALPGSRGAIRTALEKLLIPELGHLVGEGTKGHPTA